MLSLLEPVEVEDPPVVEGSPSPYLSFRHASEVVEPLCDEHYSEEGYIWCQLVQTEGDLELEECGDTSEGEVPWWWEEIHEMGLDMILDVGWSFESPKLLGWALQQGLSPYQPFLVWVAKPVWSRDYYGECDCEFEAEIIRKLPPSVNLRKFEQIIDEIYEDRRSRKQHREDLWKAQWADTSRMRLHREVYGRCSNGWPSGSMVSLVTSRASLDKEYRGYVRLATGRNDHGDYKEALKSLREQVAKEHPEVLHFFDQLA